MEFFCCHFLRGFLVVYFYMECKNYKSLQVPMFLFHEISFSKSKCFIDKTRQCSQVIYKHMDQYC